MGVFRVLLAPAVGATRAQARADLLHESLSQHFDEMLEVRVAESYAQLEAAVRDGTADLIWAPPHVCARVATEARSIYACVRHGRSSYHAGIVSRRAARVSLRNIATLRAAWVDSLSMGGHLLAKAHLRRLGLDPETLKEEAFLGTYPNVLQAVLHGDADIGSVTVHEAENGDLVVDIGLYAGHGASEIEVLAITDPCPNDALLVTHALSEDAAERLENEVLGVTGARAGRALAMTVGAERFERVSAERYDAVRGRIE